MTSPRVPWWGHNATEEALAMKRLFRPCNEGCGARIILVMPPRDEKGNRGAWTPMEQIGFNEETKTRVMAIHHDICNNPMIPGNRDPTRSHRIAKFEDEVEEPTEQLHFRPKLKLEG